MLECFNQNGLISLMCFALTKRVLATAGTLKKIAQIIKSFRLKEMGVKYKGLGNGR